MTLATELSRLLGDQHHKDVAAALGVSRSAVTQWMGGTTVPALPNLLALLDHLGVQDATERMRLIDLARDEPKPADAVALRKLLEAKDAAVRSALR